MSQCDLCLKCTTLDALTAALLPFGLATPDGDLIMASHDHALQFIGRVVQTPVEIDAEGNVVAEPVYHDGEYAILRAEAAVLDQIAAAAMEGVEIVVPPPGLPTFGGWQERPAVDLAQLRSVACARIDGLAEILCNQVITPGSAQMARYQRKEGQARAFLAATVPDDPNALAAFQAQFLAIYGEVGITADTPQAVAEVIVAMADAWWAYGDAVEAVRLAAKRDIEAAGTPAAITAVEAGVSWPELPA